MTRQVRESFVLDFQNTQTEFVLEIQNKRFRITAGQSWFQPGTLLCVTRGGSTRTLPTTLPRGSAQAADDGGCVAIDNHRIV
ncbi:hypothetical protein [Streptomyces sp. NPDC090025]|uniref:hypothetical protein n=1 Tax=Streptomyces sp. NPDC090025 TaxID=3365922 RepID=UPI0038337580